MTKSWQEQILKNFDKAAGIYNSKAELQRTFAWQLAQQCSLQSIPKGIWADLGAGTGLLAEALEALNPRKSVIRVDGSPAMIEQQSRCTISKLWDLNTGLPPLPERPALLASNFALHWLENPSAKIEEWLKGLAPGGFLAISVPILGSFPEWEAAANKAGVRFTALNLPSQKSLLEVLEPADIKYQEVHKYTQKADKVLTLLKSIIEVGAQASSKRNLTVSELRRLLNYWPCSKEEKQFNLTWLIQILLIQK